MASEPKLTGLGKLAVLLFVVGCLAGGIYLFISGGKDRPDGPSASPNTTANKTADPEMTTVGIAYGTEKKRWLLWAAEEFKKTEAGKNISLDLIPMGSLEGAHAVLDQDKRIHVWSPASAVYEDVFVRDWQVRHGGDPIVSSEPLALSPMVFITWRNRLTAFEQGIGPMNLENIRKAILTQGGWGGIAQKPEWGYFKYGHTNPTESNSGMLALVLSAYHYHDKLDQLTLEDIVDPGYQEWFRSLATGVTGLSNSTGNMMKEMVLKGPSTFDSVLVYENVAIDFLKNAEGRWGELAVVYPGKNMWNENPYYILNVPWSGEAEREGAQSFLNFLLSEPIQKQAILHGFRPANPAVSLKGTDSPFINYGNYGVKLDLPSVCAPPKAEVITNLLTGWKRTR